MTASCCGTLEVVGVIIVIKITQSIIINMAATAIINV